MPIIVPSISSSTTFLDMTNEVRANLQGYARDQEQSGTLATGLSSSGTSVTLTSSAKASAGLIEIDDETIWVDSVDKNSATITLAPWGRGYQGTEAAAHSAGTRVTFNPQFPQWRVKRAINDTISAIGDYLPAVYSTKFELTAVTWDYALPEGTTDVLDVSYKPLGNPTRWWPGTRFTWDLQADTADFPTGCMITLNEQYGPGTTVKVTTGGLPSTLTADDDSFTTVTGFPTSMYDVIVYGACARLVGFLDVSRLDYKSVEADQLDEPAQIGSAASLSRYFMQMYSTRLKEERTKFLANHQTKIRWAR